jgi:hypothetical protein
MGRRVSKTAAITLAILISLSSPSAFAASRGRDLSPGFGSQIIRVIKKFAKKFWLIADDDDIQTSLPGPPKP